jgi:hypothetical protein
LSLGRVGANRGQGLAIGLRVDHKELKKNPALRRVFSSRSALEASRLGEVVVLRHGDEVQWNVRLFIRGADFDATDDLNVSLTQPGRLCCLCHSHFSRVVRCDFIES